MNDRQLLIKVIEIAEEVGQFLKGFQPRAREIEQGYKDFLANADLEAHNLGVKKLEELTPKIPVFSEEGKEKMGRDEEEGWIVDLLDGTVNFTHQDNYWGVSIALVKNQRTQLGVIYLPAFNQTVGVTSDGDIIPKGVTLQVRPDTDLRRAQIWTDWGKELRELGVSVLSKLSKSSLYPQIRLCAVVAFMAVASGKIGAYVHPQPDPESIAAGGLVVERAGGRVTDFDGNPWTPFSKSIVASNGLLHDQILEALK